MARMYSGAKGKSGSKKPPKRIPSWAPYQEKEVEKLILKLAKSDKKASEIGLFLRDSYGIHSVKALTGKSITAILGESGLIKSIPEDLQFLIKKLNDVKKHLENNQQDETAKRGLLLTQSKIRRVTDYYKKKGKLPPDWTLDLERLKMYQS